MFDWYVGWGELKEFFKENIKEDDNLLMVGCGNSSKIFVNKIELSEGLYKAGYENITNIDISDVVIKKMNDLYENIFQKMKCNLKMNFSYRNGCNKNGI
jgi:hypothetical protein